MTRFHSISLQESGSEITGSETKMMDERHMERRSSDGVYGGRGLGVVGERERGRYPRNGRGRPRERERERERPRGRGKVGVARGREGCWLVSSPSPWLH